MSLTAKVNLSYSDGKRQPFAVPKLILWQFKMEQKQVLRVDVSPKRLFVEGKYFYSKMDKQDEYLFPS
jgi:hypothetical protein